MKILAAKRGPLNNPMVQIGMKAFVKWMYVEMEDGSSATTVEKVHAIFSAITARVAVFLVIQSKILNFFMAPKFMTLK